MMIDKFERVC